MVGYRSGRASFTSMYCTYVGAFAGYSNATSTDNTGVGAQCLFAASGSSNTAIGSGAGSSAINANCSTIVGFQAGSAAGGTYNTLIGALTAPAVSGNGNTIVGAGIGNVLVYGNCNIMVGVGADTYNSSTSYSISMGSVNVSTCDHSISVGENITSKRPYSTLLGYNITSDADNSLLLGNSINIASLTYFKDPLNAVFVDFVLQDGASKFGMNNINYANTLVTPVGTSNINASFGVITSNVYNSETAPPMGTVSPSTFDFRSNLPSGYAGYAFISGLAIPVMTDNDVTTAAYQGYSAVPGFLKSSPILTIASNIPTISDVLTTQLYNVSYSNVTESNSNIVANIVSMNASNISLTAPIYYVKQANSPLVSVSSVTSTVTSLQGGVTVDISSYVSLSTNAVSVSYSNIDYIVTNSNLPVYGQIVSQSGSYAYTYTPYLEAAMASYDTFTIIPVENIVDANNNIYGVTGPDASSNAVVVTIAKAQSLVTTSNIIFTATSNQHILTAADILLTPSPSNAASINIRITSMDPAMTITYSGATYTASNITTMVNESIDSWPSSAFTSNIAASAAAAAHISAINLTTTSNAFANISSNIAVTSNASTNPTTFQAVYVPSTQMYSYYWNAASNANFSNIWTGFSNLVYGWETVNASNRTITSNIDVFSNGAYGLIGGAYSNVFAMESNLQLFVGDLTTTTSNYSSASNYISASNIAISSLNSTSTTTATLNPVWA